MTPETLAILKQWLWADQMLYDHFYKRFRERVDNFPTMGRQVKKLSELNAQVKRDCVLVEGDNAVISDKSFRTALNISVGYMVNTDKKECVEYAVPETNFTMTIRDWQWRKKS